jgi:hypothetical protein
MPARKKTPKPTTERAASILIEAGDSECTALTALKSAYGADMLQCVADGNGRIPIRDVNAALKHGRRGERALASRADVNRPYGGETGNHVGL